MAALAFAAGTLGTVAAAHADVCVELDTQRDNLNDADRAATKSILEHTFETHGQHVVPNGCQTTYRAYHVRLGTSVTIVLSSPTDSRTTKVAKLEDVPDAYGQLVASLLSGKPLDEPKAAPPPAPPAPQTTVVAIPQDTESRAAGESLWYARLGVGGVSADGLRVGPAMGFGYRYEQDKLGIDISGFNFVLTPKDGTFDNPNGSWLRVGALYFLDPKASGSLYAGAALGWGITGAEVSSTHYTNSGVDVGLSLGYEMMRAKAVRLFLQVDADLPTYPSHGYVFGANDTDGPTRDSKYTPSFALSLGVAVGKSRSAEPAKAH